MDCLESGLWRYGQHKLFQKDLILPHLWWPRTYSLGINQWDLLKVLEESIAPTKLPARRHHNLKDLQPCQLERLEHHKGEEESAKEKEDKLTTEEGHIAAEEGERLAEIQTTWLEQFIALVEPSNAEELAVNTELVRVIGAVREGKQTNSLLNEQNNWSGNHEHTEPFKTTNNQLQSHRWRHQGLRKRRQQLRVLVEEKPEKKTKDEN